MSEHQSANTTVSLLGPEVCEKFAALQRHFREVNARMAESMAEAAESFRRFREGFPEQVGILANNGWFISSWHTPLKAVYPVADLFRRGEKDAGHRALCRHFASIRKDIEADLAKRFPRRSRILEKAFEAHDAGTYELSIPAFLAQADGIAKEILGVSIYSRRPDLIKKMDNTIAEIAGEGLDESLLRLALEALPLTASSGSGAYRKGELNRHDVLHGIDTDYSTELNSWRSISWLQYAAHFHEASNWAEHRNMPVEQVGAQNP